MLDSVSTTAASTAAAQTRHTVTAIIVAHNGARLLPFVDFKPSLQAWKSILGGDNSVLAPLWHSLAAVTLSTLIAMVLGTLAAYGLARYDVRFAWMHSRDISFFIISQR